MYNQFHAAGKVGSHATQYRDAESLRHHHQATCDVMTGVSPLYIAVTNGMPCSSGVVMNPFPVDVMNFKVTDKSSYVSTFMAKNETNT